MTAQPKLDDSNSYWVECDNCEEGYHYGECIDGLCEDAESGCDDCTYRCDICRGKGGWRVAYGTPE